MTLLTLLQNRYPRLPIEVLISTNRFAPFPAPRRTLADVDAGDALEIGVIFLDAEFERATFLRSGVKITLEDPTGNVTEQDAEPSEDGWWTVPLTPSVPGMWRIKVETLGAVGEARILVRRSQVAA